MFLYHLPKFPTPTTPTKCPPKYLMLPYGHYSMPPSTQPLLNVPYSDNEYTFYTGLEYKMNSYNVKPAIFDLFLMICIACYLAVFYLISQVRKLDLFILGNLV